MLITYNHYAAMMERFAIINEVLESAAREGEPPAEKASLCAEYYRALRTLHDEADALKKKLHKELEAYGMSILPEVFEKEDVTSLNLSSGYRVTISSVTRASIPAENKAEAYQWLVDNELGDLITNTVNASTLSATAKSLIEEGRQLPEDLFKVAVLPQVSMTKLK